MKSLLLIYLNEQVRSTVDLGEGLEGRIGVESVSEFRGLESTGGVGRELISGSAVIDIVDFVDKSLEKICVKID